MNEGAKTVIYAAVAVVMLGIALFVSRPVDTDSDTQTLIGQPLFPAFNDPLAASSLRIVTFDEGRSELDRFEVAKDESTGVWSLPSRNNYPADAGDQMEKAATALVGVKILDIQTENPEDHAGLGVLEPRAESLQAGDEGVGRLVTFKGEKNATLANLIVGNRVGDSEEKRYVRVPQQDVVYVVNLDASVFSTTFEDWIEKDLLQLSSIDISDVEIENYDATLEPGGRVSMNRNYDANLRVDGSNAWELLSLLRYENGEEPREVTLGEGEKLATSKLNGLKNALDDLKIVDVVAKPRGLSENLRADQEFLEDAEAVRSLATRGFIPVQGGEVISANGEMRVALQDGVQYVLRFGNIRGLGDTEGEEGANRYLLVTAQVDESKFPAPELTPIPKTIEELEAMFQEAEAEPADEPAPIQTPAPETETPDAPAEQPAADAPADEDPAAEEPAEATEEPAEPAEPATEDPADEPAADAAEEPAPADDVPADEPADDPLADDCAAQEDDSDDPVDPQPADETQAADETPDADAPAAETPAADTPDADAPADEAPAVIEETEEEKQERLEAEQEKITKENQRMIDERKDRLETARRRVRDLNARFADWYYVIPESTYSDLQISFDDLIERPESPAAPTQGGIPGLPGFPGGGEASDAPQFNLQDQN